MSSYCPHALKVAWLVFKPGWTISFSPGGGDFWLLAFLCLQGYHPPGFLKMFSRFTRTCLGAHVFLCLSGYFVLPTSKISCLSLNLEVVFSLNLRDRVGGMDWCSTYLCVHWLTLVRALVGVGTHNPGAWRLCSNRLSYPARVPLSSGSLSHPSSLYIFF